MSLAEALSWFQSIVEQRLITRSYRWEQLSQVLASTLASSFQVLLAYLPALPRRAPPCYQLVCASSAAPAGAAPLLLCPHSSYDDDASQCDDEDGDESSSLADTVHSLPDFLLSDAEETGAAFDYGLQLQSTRTYSCDDSDAIADGAEHSLSLIAAAPHADDLMAARLKLAAFQLSKHVFYAAPRQHQQLHAGGPPHPRRNSSYYHGALRTHRASTSSMDEMALTLHRPASTFFRTCPPLLLLPAPLFLPQALHIGLFCEKGARANNEDMAFAMKLDPATQHASGFQQAVCWGVFDGHGGVEVAAHLTECLPEMVAKRSKNIKEQGVEEVATIMLGVEDDLSLRYHSEWHPAGRDPGSTALVATIMDDSLLVANVGDCRLLLISEAADSLGNRTAFVAKATCDHHCVRNKDEAHRVRSAGAHVDADGYIGSMIEVSRSLGDFQTKAELGKGVILAEPEVYTWQLGPQDLLAVAVSDGISGSMDDMEICNMVCKLLNERKHLNDPAYAARELANFAVAKGSSDNCSAVVVVLKDQPPPEPARRRLFGRK